MASISPTHASIKPPRLKPGGTIGVIAPASPQRDDERLRRGIVYLRSKGYGVIEGRHLWQRNGYLAGTDDQRADDVNAMIRDPGVHMIVAARGGYGTTRILDRIDYRWLRRNPKIVVGFSDVTALNLAILRRAGVVSFSGALPGVDFWKPEGPQPSVEESFWRAVTRAARPGEVRQPAGTSPRALHPGNVRGPLIPANLTLLCALIGTRFLPILDGAILLLEEIGEEAYRLDRMLSHVRNAGLFRRIGGLALGAFTGTEPRRVSVDSLEVDDVFKYYMRDTAVPTVGGILYGHIDNKITLPVGTLAELDGNRGVLRLLESGVM